MIGFTGSGSVIWIGDLFESFVPVQAVGSGALVNIYSALQQLIIYIPAELEGFKAVAEIYSRAGIAESGVAAGGLAALLRLHSRQGSLFYGAELSRPIGRTSLTITRDEFGLSISV